MKTIKILSLKLTNFKGIRSLILNNLSKETFIYGDNGIGKTTVFDAFTWLLFGKDSQDRTSFEVKTLDKDNNIIPKIDHEVEANINVDGECIKIRRILREKWVKKKGSLIAEFSGNETSYEWNGVPLLAGEFSKKVSDLVDEKVFKMITNPAAFNSLKWQDQRDVLIDMSGNITNEDVAKNNEAFMALLSNLENKSLEDYKKQIKASVSKAKKEIQAIPTRIDEVERNKPETLNFKALKTDLETVNKSIENVNNQVSDKLKAQQNDIDEQKKVQSNIHSIETEVNNLKHELRQKATDDYNSRQLKPREIQRKIDMLDSEIKANESAISINNSKTSSYANQIGDLSKKIKALREEWEVENAKAFTMDESDCACPTCERKFDTNDIEEKRKDLEEHFKSNKNAKLKSITERGQSLSAQKMTLENNVITLTSELEDLQEANKSNWEKRADLSVELKDASVTIKTEDIFKELIDENQSFFNEKESEIKALNEALLNRPKVDTSELKSQLEDLNKQRDHIKSQLDKETQIEVSNKRIEALAEEEKTLGQSIADIENELFTIEAFEKEKSTRIENSVNQKFQFVDFKLFETQINGGETPTCKALIGGVPFSDANTASKINAGLDIINTLCQHYEANAPIFIDNRESVIELIPTESQIINLVVSEEDAVLRVSDKPMTYEQWKFEQQLETV